MAFVGLAITFAVPWSTRYWGNSSLIPYILLSLIVGACVGIIGLGWVLHGLLVPATGAAGKMLCAFVAFVLVVATFVVGFLFGV